MAALKWINLDGDRPALCFPGRKLLRCVIVDFPVKVIRLECELAALRDVVQAGSTEPRVCARSLLGVGRRMGITKGAKRLLLSILEDEQ